MGGVCGGSDLIILGNYFKYFCLNVAFLTCLVVTFKLLWNTIKYWASFSTFAIVCVCVCVCLNLTVLHYVLTHQ